MKKKLCDVIQGGITLRSQGSPDYEGGMDRND